VANDAVYHFRISVTCTEPHQQALIGVHSSNSGNDYVTRWITCLLLPSRNCGVCAVASPNSGHRSCSTSFGSIVSIQSNERPPSPPLLRTKCLVSLGVIFWLDGWDPSASLKNNRSPVHTSTVTLLCINNTTCLPFNARTFPIACGPGKEDHNCVF
jgi:hypothetical protein